MVRSSFTNCKILTKRKIRSSLAPHEPKLVTKTLQQRAGHMVMVQNPRPTLVNTRFKPTTTTYNVYLTVDPLLNRMRNSMKSSRSIRHDFEEERPNKNVKSGCLISCKPGKVVTTNHATNPKPQPKPLDPL